MAAALDAAGAKAKYVDALDLVHTDSAFGQAAPDFARTDRSVQRTLFPLLARGIIPVVPGFIGATPEGEVATLGRGGSDLTATLLARALGAARVSLWKDVPGLLTADPRVVPDARVIPQLHAREAAELAYYGAKVLHPRALIPVAGRRIPVFVRPFADPDSAGTEVSERVAPGRFPVKALTAAGGQALVTVTGNGMLGVPGIAARTFHALHLGRSRCRSSRRRRRSTRSASACPSRSPTTRARASSASSPAEIRRGEIDGVEVSPGMATVAVVGLGMHGTPGVAAGGVLGPRGRRINVVAIAQGSSELNISVVVDDARQAGEAQRRIHAAFQLSRIAGGAVIQPERMEVVLLGFGQIGRSAVRARSARCGAPRWTWVAGVIDRSGFVFDPRGLGPRRLAALAADKRKGKRLADAPRGQAATAEEAIAAHRELRPHAPGTGGPDGRRHRPGARAGADPRHGPGARQQAAACGPPRGERGAVADGARTRAAGAARGDRRCRAADHRHVPQADRERRPRGADRGAAVGHTGLRADARCRRACRSRGRCGMR